MSVQTETGTIHLGGQDFTVTGFTFDQLQRLMPAFRDLRKSLAEGGLEAARDIIATALEGVIGADELKTLRTNVTEIMTAVPVVARLSGLQELGESMLRAEMMETSTGTGFTQPSAPGLDGTGPLSDASQSPDTSRCADSGITSLPSP